MVLAIATAGLIYELGMAAVASYVLGDSVRQFSIVIGAYLSALGLGAYLSRYIERRLAATFVNVELSAALLGGLSSPGLIVAFSLGASFQTLLLVIVVSVGTLVGIELPLLMRILERQLPFKELIARALTYDYAGALVGSLGFSLYLVPALGLVQTSIVCGILNALVGLAATWLLFAHDDSSRRTLILARGASLGVITILLIAFFLGPGWVARCEARSYGQLVHTEDSAYQRILLTRRDAALELYLNGHLQFSSRDECRYHEALIHPALATIPSAHQVLVCGGGDGLAVREILRWPGIDRIVLVDLDPAMTTLARQNPELLALNQRSLNDPRVIVRNADAFNWVAQDSDRYDLIVLDFPDPTTYGVGKLFTTTFYAQAARLLARDGTLVIQATSPLLSPNSFWSIERTVAAVGMHTLPLRVYLPSFGDWGFVLAKHRKFEYDPLIPSEVALHCLARTHLARLTEFPDDTRRTGAIEVNRLSNQALVNSYLDEAKRLD